MTLHLLASSTAGKGDDIERGEAVRRPHGHPGGMWEAFVTWLRDFIRGNGSAGR